ncbi:MAG: hypothetical protein NPIRA04_00020 [Nitrospirales bacterium]|nr:MAG: hypothetical protein NPIRA04_00020 [Nitrospirales bacterium]
MKLSEQRSTSEDNRDSQVLSAGSLWLRWDPHFNASGTLLNDQFSREPPFDEYLSRLEAAVPTVKAFGITDYYSVSNYRAVFDAKLAGSLEECDLIFSNVEMRLSIGTAKGKCVNTHVLICPDDV